MIKNKNDKNKNCKKHNNFSTNIKPLHINKIIDDLEKPEEIKIKDYENKINIIKKNQKFDKINLNNNNKNKNKLNKDKLKGVVKTLNFKDISNNEKKEEKEDTNIKRENKIVPKIKNIFFSTKNTATGEKIRKKYERSEFKKNRILLNSAIINNKNLINFLLNENKENISYNDKIELTKK